MTADESNPTTREPFEVPLTDNQWINLVDRIYHGRVTLFLGAGASYGHVALGKQVINQWLPNASTCIAEDLAGQLPHVAQHRKLFDRDEDAIMVKQDFIEQFVRGRQENIDFKADGEPLGRLARLPFETVITTNYDDLMAEAFTQNNKTPAVTTCQWNCDDLRERERRLVEQKALSPSKTAPVIFHLHGHHTDAKSLVLLEEDFEHFLAKLLKPNVGSLESDDILPDYVYKALSQSILFVGYSMGDMTFRSVFRGVLNRVSNINRAKSVTVQYDGITKQQAQYTEAYYRDLKIAFVNQSAADFTKALEEHWRAKYGNGN